MAEPIVGTPAIVGFGNGIGDGNLSIATLLFLMQQRTDAGMCELTRDIHRETHQNDINITTQGAANQLAIEKIGAATELAIEKTAAATHLAIVGTVLEAQKIAGIAALTAATNQASTLAAIAECCCETRALIIEKANGTDALIRQIEDARVRDLLADAKAEIAALKAAAK